MAYTQTDVERVETAINNAVAAAGVAAYSADGVNVQRYSLDQLTRLRARMLREVNRSSTQTVRASLRGDI